MTKLELNDQDLQVLGAALGKLPFETVAGLVQKLNQQIADQQPKVTPEIVKGKKNV